MIANLVKEPLIKSVRGECFRSHPSIHLAAQGTQGEQEMYRTMVSDLIRGSLMY